MYYLRWKVHLYTKYPNKSCPLSSLKHLIFTASIFPLQMLSYGGTGKRGLTTGSSNVHFFYCLWFKEKCSMDGCCRMSDPSFLLKFKVIMNSVVCKSEKDMKRRKHNFLRSPTNRNQTTQTVLEQIKNSRMAWQVLKLCTVYTEVGIDVGSAV